ncbi:MAG: VOC family protein [Acidimicrobiia bacterium]|nr:VOC family protein [Acidimicrobiia bacterium]
MATRGFISHLDLNVSDPDRSLPFYELVLGYLGFISHSIDDRRRFWSLATRNGPELAIEIRPPSHPPPRRYHERYTPGIDHLAFHAESRAAVDELARLLVEAGYEVADPPAEYGYTAGYYAVAFDDPDGIRLEVVHEPAANP